MTAPSVTFSGNEWNSYLQALDWSPGNRDASGYKALLRAASLGEEPARAVVDVAERIKASGGSYSVSKLKSQMRRAYAFVTGNGGDATAILTPASLKFDPATLEALANKVSRKTREELKQLSPVPVAKTNTADFLNSLYRQGEKVLVFTDFHSQGEILFEVGGSSNSAIPKLTAEGAWFLVNPVDGQEHPNPRQENKLSRRSEESVTAWRYLVLESDVAPEEQWLACLVQLPIKIAAIYTSGGKSVHALVRVEARTKAEWDTIASQFKPILVPLGADPAAMTGVRLSRLPGVKRGTVLQELLYLNPNPEQKSIIQSKS